MNRGTLKPELSALTRRNGPFGTNAGRAMLSVGHRSRYRRRWRGWHDEAIVLPREWSSTDPDGLHQQPVLVPSLWGGSGPRHPRDAQFARRDADAISTSRAGLIARLLSRTVTPCLAWRPRDEATASSPVARHGVRHRDWAVRLRRPRLAARPHANVRRSRLALAAHCDRAPTLLDPDRQASLQSWICALGGPGSG